MIFMFSILLLNLSSKSLYVTLLTIWNSFRLSIDWQHWLSIELVIEYVVTDKISAGFSAALQISLSGAGSYLCNGVLGVTYPRHVNTVNVGHILINSCFRKFNSSGSYTQNGPESYYYECSSYCSMHIG